MSRGGSREGAGRKKGAANLLTQELREQIDAQKLIRFLQDVADGKIEGSSINERKDAAVALIKKVLPDCRQMDIKETPEPVTLVIDVSEEKPIST